MLKINENKAVISAIVALISAIISAIYGTGCAIENLRVEKADFLTTNIMKGN